MITNLEQSMAIPWRAAANSMASRSARIHQLVSEPSFPPPRSSDAKSHSGQRIYQEFRQSHQHNQIPHRSRDPLFFSAVPSKFGDQDTSPEEEEEVRDCISFQRNFQHRASSHFQIPYKKDEAIIYESQGRDHLHQKNVRSEAQFHKIPTSISYQEHTVHYDGDWGSQQQWTSREEGKSENQFNSFRSDFSQSRSRQDISEIKEGKSSEKMNTKQFPTNNINEVMTRLHYLVDEGCFDSYFDEFVELVFPIDRLVTSSNESFIHVLLMDLFVSGLQEENQLYVLQSAPSNLLHAMNLATYYEEEVKHEDDDPWSQHEEDDLEAETVSRICEEEVMQVDEDEVDKEVVDEEDEGYDSQDDEDVECTCYEKECPSLIPNLSDPSLKSSPQLSCQASPTNVKSFFKDEKEDRLLRLMQNIQLGNSEATQKQGVCQINSIIELYLCQPLLGMGVEATLMKSLPRPPPKPPWLSTYWELFAIINSINCYQRRRENTKQHFTKQLAGKVAASTQSAPMNKIDDGTRKSEKALNFGALATGGGSGDGAPKISHDYRLRVKSKGNGVDTLTQGTSIAGMFQDESKTTALPLRHRRRRSNGLLLFDGRDFWLRSRVEIDFGQDDLIDTHFDCPQFASWSPSSVAREQPWSRKRKRGGDECLHFATLQLLKVLQWARPAVRSPRGLQNKE